MSVKDEKEIVELLWSITEKLDKILAAVRKSKPHAVVEGDSAAQMSIDTGEPK